MTAFIPGLQLSELFFQDVVNPLLRASFHSLRYSAGLLGPGSEVLGFDTPRSTDHDWGPRVLLFLAEDEFSTYQSRIVEMIGQSLPREFRGYATSFEATSEAGTHVPERTSTEIINHRVDVTTLSRFLRKRLGIATYPEIAIADWLTFSEQSLLEVTGGRVFHDGLGELGSARATFRYYPRDLWLYLLATQWGRIAQQEAFVGRSGDVGDDLGSSLIAATLVRDLMRLGFLMERTYAPYSKWFGTAFARLTCAPRLLPIFENVVRARSWPERQTHLGSAYSTVAAMHNELGITDPLPTDVSQFHDRPYVVLNASRFSDAIYAIIADDRVRQLPRGIGSIDQYVDSTDLLTLGTRHNLLRAVYLAEA